VVLFVKKRFSFLKGVLVRCVVVWSVIWDRFKGYPGREKVVKFLLEHGFQVNRRGHVGVNGVEIPHLQIGGRVGVGVGSETVWLGAVGGGAGGPACRVDDTFQTRRPITVKVLTVKAVRVRR